MTPHVPVPLPATSSPAQLQCLICTTLAAVFAVWQCHHVGVVCHCCSRMKGCHHNARAPNMIFIARSHVVQFRAGTHANTRAAPRPVAGQHRPAQGSVGGCIRKDMYVARMGSTPACMGCLMQLCSAALTLGHSANGVGIVWGTHRRGGMWSRALQMEWLDVCVRTRCSCASRAAGCHVPAAAETVPIDRSAAN